MASNFQAPSLIKNPLKKFNSGPVEKNVHFIGRPNFLLWDGFGAIQIERPQKVRLLAKKDTFLFPRLLRRY